MVCGSILWWLDDIWWLGVVCGSILWWFGDIRWWFGGVWCGGVVCGVFGTYPFVVQQKMPMVKYASVVPQHI